MSKLLTTKEMAALLSVTPITLQRMVREGRVPAIRIASNSYRFNATKVMATLEGDLNNDF